MQRAVMWLIDVFACMQIGEFVTTGKVAALDPANQAAEAAAKAAAAEEKATGDAFAFV